MSPDDPSVEGAVAETTNAGEAPASDPTEGAEESTKDKWRQALDRYLEGNLPQALTLVDEILREDPTTDLRPRLERLKRRALDRLEKPEGAEEPAAEAAPEKPEAAAATEEKPPEKPAEKAPSAEKPAAEKPPERPTQKIPSGERSGKTPSGERPTRRPTARLERDKLDPKLAEKRASSDALPTIGGGESAELPRPAVAAPDLEVVGGESSDPAPTEAAAEPSAPPVEGGAAETPDPDAAGAGPPPAPAVEVSAETADRPPRRATPGPGQILKRQVGPARRASTSGSGVHATTAAPPNGQLTQLQAGVDKVHAGVEKLGSGVEQAHKILGRLQADLRSVAEAYQRVSKDSKRKDQAYDQLYEELRQYKDDFLLNAQKPLFRDVILIYDGIARTIAAFEGREGDTLPKEDVLTALKHMRDEVLEVLYRRDVERVEEEPTKLNIDIQKPVRRLDTDDPTQDREVVQVLRDGFRLRGTILRPQEVTVKRYVEAGARDAGAAAAPANPAPSRGKE